MTAIRSSKKPVSKASTPLSSLATASEGWKPYPAYKPSGVEWLGDVPEGWDVKRLKTSATCWVSNVDKVPDEDELPVRLCNYTDVYYNDHISPDMGLMETTATANEIRRFGLLVGDVVITKDSEEWSDIAVPALVKQSAPDLVCGYHLAIIRSHANKLYGDYLLRAFQSCAVNQQFQIAASGVTRYGLPKASIGDAWVPLPAPSEQRAIADFLDRETGKIDRLVAKKRELIEKLKEERAALISRTVTRGLNADAAFKPSGVEWLGDVPVGWTVSKVRFEARLVSKGTTPSTIGKELVDDGVRFIKAENIQENKVTPTPEFFIDAETDQLLSRSRLKAKDVLVVIAGATTGKVAVLENAFLPANTNQAVCFIRLKFAVYSTLLAYWMGTKFMQDHVWTAAVQSAQPNLAMENIRAFPCLVPSLPEQRAIADFLDREIGKIDRLAAKVEEAIGRLQEYRAALITAAVTGKIDVRGEMATLEYPEAAPALLKAAEEGVAYGRKNMDKHLPAPRPAQQAGGRASAERGTFPVNPVTCGASVTLNQG